MVGPWSYGESLFFCWIIQDLIMIHHIFDHFRDVVKFRVLFVKLEVIFLDFLVRSLPVVTNHNFIEFCIGEEFIEFW